MGVLTEGTLGLSGISPRFPYRITSNVSGNRLLTRAAPMGGARDSDRSRDRQGAVSLKRAVSLKQATDNYCLAGVAAFFGAGAAVFLAGAAGAAGGGP